MRRVGIGRARAERCIAVGKARRIETLADRYQTLRRERRTVEGLGLDPLLLALGAQLLILSDTLHGARIVRDKAAVGHDAVDRDHALLLAHCFTIAAHQVALITDLRALIDPLLTLEMRHLLLLTLRLALDAHLLAFETRLLLTLRLALDAHLLAFEARLLLLALNTHLLTLDARLLLALNAHLLAFEAGLLLALNPHLLTLEARLLLALHAHLLTLDTLLLRRLLLPFHAHLLTLEAGLLLLTLNTLLLLLRRLLLPFGAHLLTLAARRLLLLLGLGLLSLIAAALPAAAAMLSGTGQGRCGNRQRRDRRDQKGLGHEKCPDCSRDNERP